MGLTVTPMSPMSTTLVARKGIFLFGSQNFGVKLLAFSLVRIICWFSNVNIESNDLCYGMLVQDPTRGGGDVDSIFTQARQFAQGPLEPSSSSKSFTGTARTLTGETVPTAAPQPPESINHTITLWRNGFSIDDGPLRRLDDPENAAFLEVSFHEIIQSFQLFSELYTFFYFFSIPAFVLSEVYSLPFL
ncbi:putative SEP domain-containing protein [Rosa chinensis]|uniref:Putative SEP domain-containing protein n=1 Tax=Rosa chinensis TaxID=74649 RepID=A0A2P6S2B2_ROSCH|nr:putative SEP domain-containing protein [Rosa chinensis]